MLPLVCFHADCPDGFCASWIANRHFGGEAEFRPVKYGQDPPDVADRDVFVLDFHFPRSVTLDLARRAQSLVVLDHHKTAWEDFHDLIPGEGLAHVRTAGVEFSLWLDQGKCGARLAWEYFFPLKPVPFLVRVVEDRDLWRWALPRSRELNAWLASLPRDFAGWDQIANDLTEPGQYKSEAIWDRYEESAIEQGAAILRYQAQQIEAACRSAREIELDGHKILCCNATALVSEITGKLAEGRPFAATYRVREDGKIVWSLRSREGGVDVSEIAKRHGGGGHVRASGWEEDPT